MVRFNCPSGSVPASRFSSVIAPSKDQRLQFGPGRIDGRRPGRRPAADDHYCFRCQVECPLRCTRESPSCRLAPAGSLNSQAAVQIKAELYALVAARLCPGRQFAHSGPGSSRAAHAILVVGATLTADGRAATLGGSSAISALRPAACHFLAGLHRGGGDLGFQLDRLVPFEAPGLAWNLTTPSTLTAIGL